MAAKLSPQYYKSKKVKLRPGKYMPICKSALTVMPLPGAPHLLIEHGVVERDRGNIDQLGRRQGTNYMR